MEGYLRYTVTLTNFEGPLELLLRLIERDQLDITQIALGQVTDDYLKHMNRLALRAEELNWFIEIAAKLVGFKASVLLPDSEREADEVSLQDLTKQLQTYRLYRDAAVVFGQLAKTPLTTRPAELINEAEDLPLANATTADLAQAYIRAHARSLDAQANLPPRFIIKKTTINHAIKQLEAKFARQRKIDLDKLLGDAGGRDQKVLYFLAVLEMLKTNRINLIADERQADHYTLELQHA